MTPKEALEIIYGIVADTEGEESEAKAKEAYMVIEEAVKKCNRIEESRDYWKSTALTLLGDVPMRKTRKSRLNGIEQEEKE